MQMAELLDSVQYITDTGGKRKRVLLDLEVWQEVVQLLQQTTAADSDGTSGTEIVADAKREAAMLREEAAFRRLHPSLYKQHPGKFVAIFHEQLIDSDADQSTLYRRVRQQYPGEFVWIAPVRENPDEVLVFAQ